MLRRIPKVLLLVAFLTALVVSSAPILGGECGPAKKKYCGSSFEATNCSFDKNGNCSTQKCTPGGPCNYSTCVLVNSCFL